MDKTKHEWRVENKRTEKEDMEDDRKVYRS